MIYPLTWILMVLFLLFYLAFDGPSSEAQFIRIIDGIFALLIGLFTFGGEAWIAVDPQTNALSLTNFDTGFAYIEAFFMIGIGFIVMYSSMFNIGWLKRSLFNRGRNK